MTARTLPLQGKQIAALRSIASSPQGLREGAFPSVMKVLEAHSLVEKRTVPRAWHPGGVGWFLTEAGKEAVRIYGPDED